MGEETVIVDSDVRRIGRFGFEIPLIAIDDQPVTGNVKLN